MRESGAGPGSGAGEDPGEECRTRVAPPGSRRRAQDVQRVIAEVRRGDGALRATTKSAAATRTCRTLSAAERGGVDRRVPEQLREEAGGHDTHDGLSNRA